MAAKEPEIFVDEQTAVFLKIQEFDKHITAAELEVARLKNAKAVYVFDTNVQLALKKHSQSNNAAAQPPAEKKVKKYD
jgi:hypothetical protein